MYLKPKSSVLNPRALLYRRFTAIITSSTKPNIFVTPDGQQWTFDSENAQFIISTVIDGNIVNVTEGAVFAFSGMYFRYDTNANAWVSSSEPTQIGVQLLSKEYGKIAKYQTNQYYFSGSFDFMVRGSIEGSTAQYIKGRITPLSSMNIRTFTDDVAIAVDDLIVCFGKLWSVENPELTQKRSPKAFNIYFATLNSVL